MSSFDTGLKRWFASIGPGYAMLASFLESEWKHRWGLGHAELLETSNHTDSLILRGVLLGDVATLTCGSRRDWALGDIVLADHNDVNELGPAIL